MLRIVLVTASIHPLTLSDSQPHDDPLMRDVTGARSGRCGQNSFILPSHQVNESRRVYVPGLPEDGWCDKDRLHCRRRNNDVSDHGIERHMIIHQFFVPGIAHSSYIVAGDKTCAVIDPERDVTRYLDAATQMGLRITHILETHLHADFVSGHLDLADATRARIYASRSANCAFPHVALAEGDEISLEDIHFSVIETAAPRERSPEDRPPKRRAAHTAEPRA